MVHNPNWNKEENSTISAIQIELESATKMLLTVHRFG
jgi:hypothetical protein